MGSKVRRKRKNLIDKSLSVISNKHVPKNVDVGNKRLGLNMALIGLAEIQANVLSKKLRQIEIIESKLFSKIEDEDSGVDNKDLIYILRILHKSLSDSSSHISYICNNIDWTKLQVDIESSVIKGAAETSQDTGVEIKSLLYEIAKHAAFIKNDK